ncbi:uncharacterized protein [Dendropsophus ebraccatus]|uniref:uncharacterized protein n=1 Tax=Dendropsophus ebraccatus TaxID=150705 RepID=UPI003831C383
MPIEMVDSIVKAVRQTMAIEDDPQPRTIQDIMFEGLAPKQRPVFPIHQSIKTLISNEWSRPDRKFFVPRAYKRKYPFSTEESVTWETAPKIDPPVAKLTRKDALPFEDSASMRDPMDKRAEVYLRKNWEATTATFKPLIATTSVARATDIWVAQLKERIISGASKEQLLASFPIIEGSLSFMAEASADALKLSARSAALSNSARRTLWLRDWKGDVTSRAKLCAVPCEGDLLFGSALEKVLEKASDKKKGFPLVSTQTSRPSRGRGRRGRGGAQVGRKDWRPPKKDYQVPSLVDREGQLKQGATMEHSRPPNDNNRRKSVRMGGPLRLPGAPGEMEPRAFPGLSEHQRAKGNISGVNTVPSCNSGKKCKNPHGQCHGCGILKPPGGHQVSRTDEALSLYFQASGAPPSLPVSPASQGSGQLHSRLPKQTPTSSRGVGIKSGGIPSNMPPMGPPTNRPLCLPTEQEDPSLLFPMPVGQAVGSRRSSTIMEDRPSVRLPSDKTAAPSHQEDQTGQGAGYTDCTILAQEGVVHLATQNVTSGSLDSTGANRSPQPGPSIPSRSKESPSDSMAFERQLLKDRGLSEEVISTLLASRKKVTSEIYFRIWKTFLRFVDHPVNVLEPPNMPLILSFLQEGLNKHLRPSTIKVQISALSALYEVRLAEHPWIKRFIKAAMRLYPSIKTRLPPWDLNLVLSGLTSTPFEPISEIHIKFLSWKVAFLLAITSARRLGEIRAFSITQPYMVIRDDRITLSPDPAFLPKVVSDFHRSQEVILPSFCINPSNDREASFHCLDVRRAIIHYLEVTKDWRIDNNILITFQGKNKGRAATSQTISRWIKQAIKECYRVSGRELPNSITAHSTRSVSTSWAERAAVSIEDICRAATWSSPHTFFRHYRLQLSPSEDLRFGRRVLQAVVPP